MKIVVNNYYLINDKNKEDSYTLIKVIGLDKYSDSVFYKVIAIKEINSDDWSIKRIFHSIQNWHVPYKMLESMITKEYTEEEVVVEYFGLFLKRESDND